MSERKTRHLSVLKGGKQDHSAPITRAEVASRLGVSISTVRRYEGDRLHPKQGLDGVRKFDPAEVATLAAELVGDPSKARDRLAPRVPGSKPVPRSADEIAAEVFARLEQRQSLAEIVIGARVAPDRVYALYDQWCLGLVQHQLIKGKSPAIAESDYRKVGAEALLARLQALPHTPIRISVGRFRGSYVTTSSLDDEMEAAWITELGGFQVGGPCTLAEITDRFGPGDYRVTAYQLDPAGVLWEVIARHVA